jgi:hypothetical protein
MALGVVAGVFAGLWTLVGPQFGGVPWFFGIGLIKLVFVSGLGLIAAGAGALRIANRQDAMRLPGEAPEEEVITADRKALRRDARLKQ